MTSAEIVVASDVVVAHDDDDATMSARRCSAFVAKLAQCYHWICHSSSSVVGVASVGVHVKSVLCCVVLSWQWHKTSQASCVCL